MEINNIIPFSLIQTGMELQDDLENNLDDTDTNSWKNVKRQYSITCEQDSIDIEQGYCPYYASFWTPKENEPFWGKNCIFKYRDEYVKKIENYEEDKKKVSFDVFKDVFPEETLEKEPVKPDIHFDISMIMDMNVFTFLSKFRKT